MSRIAYRCKSQEEQKQVCVILECLGYKYAFGIDESDKNPTEFSRDFKSYPVIGLGSDDSIMGWGCDRNDCQVNTLAEFLNRVVKTPFMIGNDVVTKIGNCVKFGNVTLNVDTLNQLLTLAESD